MKLHCFQHVPFEGLGSIEPMAQDNDYHISRTRFYNGESPPEMDKIDCLIVLGGPMNIYDYEKHPWLYIEKEAIKEAIAKNKIVIDICLGAQLIADVLGAKIKQNNHKEIGWFKIKKNPAAQSVKIADFLPDEALAFHWHGDTFDIPVGAIPLAYSEVCQNQGFIYKEKVLAMQFHLESTKESVELLIKNNTKELIEAAYIQKPEEILKCEHCFIEINFLMENLLLTLFENN